MSRSPKYTTARLTAQRELELARQRAAREAARRAAAEAAARVRLAKRTGEQRNALNSLERRLAALRATALQVNAQARADKIRRRLHTIRARLKDAADLAAVDAVAGNISALAAQLDRYAEDVAATLAQRERARALDAIHTALDACPQRIEFDAEGDIDVRAHFDRATTALTDQARFKAAHEALAAAVRAHLGTAARRSKDLDEAIEEADTALTAIGQVLGEAHAAGAVLPGMGTAAAAASRLRLDMAARLAGECRRGATALRQATGALSTALEEWFERLDRAQQVVEAATIALPKAGFRVEPGSLVRNGTEVTFRALRADGTPLDIGITSAETGDVRISYQGTGPDYMAEHTVNGTVATCDLTAQMLERFHAELSREAVETNGLSWEGKPDKHHSTAVPHPAHRNQHGRRA